MLDFLLRISEFHLLHSGKVSFQKPCGSFFLDKGLAIWQVVCLLLCHRNEHGGSWGRRLCHSSFLPGRTRWVGVTAAVAARCWLCGVCQMGEVRWSRSHPVSAARDSPQRLHRPQPGCRAESLLSSGSPGVIFIQGLGLGQQRYASHADPLTLSAGSQDTLPVTKHWCNSACSTFSELASLVLEIGAIFSLIANTAWKEFYICLFWSLL